MARHVVRTRADLANAIRDLRRERGLTQEELADWVGVHRNYIGQLERGEMSTQVERTFDVLSLLGVDVVLVERGSHA
jgi:transcriptional regulator with XRE-family HTH domain